jgi:hypothetical protein
MLIQRSHSVQGHVSLCFIHRYCTIRTRHLISYQILFNSVRMLIVPSDGAVSWLPFVSGLSLHLCSAVLRFYCWVFLSPAIKMAGRVMFAGRWKCRSWSFRLMHFVGGYQRFGGTYSFRIDPTDGGSTSSETLLTRNKIARRYNPEYQCRHLHRSNLITNRWFLIQHFTTFILDTMSLRTKAVKTNIGIAG